jgi:rRNA processing protein Gar1
VRVEPRDRDVGVVVAVTPTGNLTVRSSNERLTLEGTPVVDRTGRIHGRVARVFGPVARPYLSVRLRRAPRPEEGVGLVGSTLRTEKGVTDGT